MKVLITKNNIKSYGTLLIYDMNLVLDILSIKRKY